MDLTVIVYNNSIYGMTGGQYSPTTPPGAFAATAPYGNVERSFDICKVARDAGAVFVARATVAQPLILQRYIKRGIEKKGFAVIDAVTPCPALYSFFNRTGTGSEMMKTIRERSVTIQRFKSLPEDSRKEKIVCGVFADRKDDEYNDVYGTLMEKAKTEQEGEESL